jgi:DNA-binding response OmpR family regulator
MRKILVIEDDLSYIENIKILLEEEGFDVVSASNGFDGIDVAKNEIPGLIICDIALDGYSILIELRKEKNKIDPSFSDS